MTNKEIREKIKSNSNTLKLKIGKGELFGISNFKNQPKKCFIIRDGDTVIISGKLDVAFPDEIVIDDEGVQSVMPGMIIKTIFVKSLVLETDGEDIKMYYQ